MAMLSLAMIVRNEAAILGHCLASVKDLVDEIVVVDTGSTDGTVEAAEAFGARIGRFPWVDDFAAARNASLELCTGDWVLILDADEAIDALDLGKLRDACERPTADAYLLTLRNYAPSALTNTLDVGVGSSATAYTEGRDCPFFADGPGFRLARRFPGLRFQNRIHESLEASLEGRTVRPLDVVVHHYGKLFQAREDAKATYYLGLAREEARTHPSRSLAWFNLLQQALVAGQWEEALQAADRIMALEPRVHPLVPFGAGTALQELGRHPEALERFGFLLAQRPDHAPALIRQATSLARLGRLDEARVQAARARAAQPDYLPVYGDLAELEFTAGNFPAARQAVVEALARAPQEAKFHAALLKIDAELGDPNQTVQDAWAAIQALPGGGGGRWHQLVAVFLLREGEAASAREILELGLAHFPGDPDLCRLLATCGMLT